MFGSRAENRACLKATTTCSPSSPTARRRWSSTPSERGRSCVVSASQSTLYRARGPSSRKKSTRSTRSREQPSFEGFGSMSVPRRIAAFLALASQNAARTLAATNNRPERWLRKRWESKGPNTNCERVGNPDPTGGGASEYELTEDQWPMPRRRKPCHRKFRTIAERGRRDPNARIRCLKKQPPTNAETGETTSMSNGALIYANRASICSPPRRILTTDRRGGDSLCKITISQ